MVYPQIKALQKVSIVIATYNAAHTLAKCIDSILSQDYPSKELIIIDGGSDDGTIDLLEKYHSYIHYCCSEPDGGIYHAWNKALKIISGDWVLFIGADDYFLFNEAISQMMQLTGPEIDFVSAKVSLISKKGKVIKELGRPWNSFIMKRWMALAHPGMLHNRKLFTMYGGFSVDYRIAGDYEFIMRVSAQKLLQLRFLDTPIIGMLASGISNQHTTLAIKENYLIQKKIFPHLKLLFWLNYIYIRLKLLVKKVLRNV